MEKKPLPPLRKIVATRWDHEHGRVIETYECGHERHQPNDIYGPTNAYRRRCRRCRALPLVPEWER